MNQVLAGDSDAAHAIASETDSLPFLVTREASVMRSWLRKHGRGLRRAGLLASSGGVRLRAEGSGQNLRIWTRLQLHIGFSIGSPMTCGRRMRWRWSALNSVARAWNWIMSDFAGMLILFANLERRPWLARQFRGTNWQVIRQLEAIANQINTYRVLLPAPATRR